MATRLELAQFSAAVYGSPKKIEGWERVAVFDRPDTDYYGEAYFNSDANEVVITNRGTRPTSVKDLFNDVKLTAHVATQAQQYAAEFAIEVAEQYKGVKIVETGHSLGGNNAAAGLAALVELKIPNVSMVTFNAPGIGGYDHLAPSSYDAINYFARGDMIHLAGGDHLGTSQELPAGPAPGSNLKLTPLALLGPIGMIALAVKQLWDTVGPAHSIDTIVDYLSTGQEGAVPTATLKLVDSEHIVANVGGHEVKFTLESDGNIKTTTDIIFSTVNQDGTKNDYEVTPDLYHFSHENEEKNAGFVFEIENNGAELQRAVQAASVPGRFSVSAHDDHKTITSAINSKGDYDIAMSGTIHGLTSRYEIHFGDNLSDAHVKVTYSDYSEEATIFADGSVELSYNGSVKRMNADHTVEGSSYRFQADGSGEWTERVSSSNQEGHRYETYSVDADGNITGNGSDQGVGLFDSSWTLKWVIQDGKRVDTLTNVNRNGDTSVTVSESTVDSDVVRNGGLVTHKKSGLTLDQGGNVVAFRAAEVSILYDEYGNPESINLFGTHAYRLDNGKLVINLGQDDGINLYQTRNADGQVETSLRDETGEMANVTMRPDGRISYYAGIDSASFSKDGNLESFYHGDLGAAITPLGMYASVPEGGVSINFGTGISQFSSTDSNSGTIMFADGRSFNYDDGSIIGSDGSVGSFEKSIDGFTAKLVYADGSTGSLVSDADGTAYEDRYSADGTVLTTKDVQATYTVTESILPDGSARTVFAYNDGSRDIRINTLDGEVLANSFDAHGILIKKSVTNADGSGEVNKYAMDKLVSSQTYSADGSSATVYYNDARELKELVSQTGVTVSTYSVDDQQSELVVGTYGDNVLYSSGLVSVVAGNRGNDSLVLTAENSLICFNAGDGRDDVVLTEGAKDVLSIGNVDIGDISLVRRGNSLTIDTGFQGAIVISHWFDGPQTIERLQLISTANDHRTPSDTDGDQITVYNLKGLVAQLPDEYRATLAIAPTASDYLLYSGDDVIGGDLAYYQAHQATLAYLTPDAKFETANTMLAGLIGQQIHEYKSIFQDIL